MLFSALRVTLTGGRAVRAVLGRGAGLVLIELSGGERLVVNVSIGVVVGVFGFLALGRGVETFPGAGGGAVFKIFSREVGIFPAGGGGDVFRPLWEGVSFLAENGAGAVFIELGLEVVAAFLDDVTTDVLGGFRVFGGDLGRPGFNFLCLRLGGEPDFFATPAADILVVAVVVAVVVIVAAVVGSGVVGL